MQAIIIHHLPTKIDYREKSLIQKGVYFSPLNTESQIRLEEYFTHFSLHESVHIDAIVIASRSIQIIKRSHNIIWFDFYVLCNTPRSQIDYLEIAKNYSVVILSGIPQMIHNELNDSESKNITYFIRLIDIFYDHHIKLICSAEVNIEDLYTQGPKIHEFQRTRSRLIEMQSHDYWHLEHRI
jgi:cell division protein ZapE